MEIENKAVVLMEETLKIASDETRLKILFTLLNNLEDEEEFVEKSVNNIANEIGCSQSLVSHQLKVLKDGNFIKARKEGKNVFYSLKDEHVRQILRIAYEHAKEEL